MIWGQTNLKLGQLSAVMWLMWQWCRKATWYDGFGQECYIGVIYLGISEHQAWVEPLETDGCVLSACMWFAPRCIPFSFSAFYSLWLGGQEVKWFFFHHVNIMQTEMVVCVDDTTAAPSPTGDGGGGRTSTKCSLKFDFGCTDAASALPSTSSNGSKDWALSGCQRGRMKNLWSGPWWGCRTQINRKNFCRVVHMESEVVLRASNR